MSPDIDWTRKATVAIAIFAFAATMSSAIAAWESWRTARAVESISRENFDLAREVAQVSGAAPDVEGRLELSGGCGIGQRLVATTFFRNHGHLATDVNSVGLQANKKDSVPPRGTLLGNDQNLAVSIAPQQESKVSTQLDCNGLSSLGINGDHAGNDLAMGILKDEIVVVAAATFGNGDYVSQLITVAITV